MAALIKTPAGLGSDTAARGAQKIPHTAAAATRAKSTANTARNVDHRAVDAAYHRHDLEHLTCKEDEATWVLSGEGSRCMFGFPARALRQRENTGTGTTVAVRAIIAVVSRRRKVSG